MNRSQKFWIIFSLVIVFVVGMIAGVLLDDNVLNKMQRPQEKKRNSAQFPSMCTMAEELSLSEAQQNKIREIFKENDARLSLLRKQIHKQFASIRSKLIEEIKSILDEDQKLKFENMIDRYISQRKKEMKKRNERMNKTKKKKGESK